MCLCVMFTYSLKQIGISQPCICLILCLFINDFKKEKKNVCYKTQILVMFRYYFFWIVILVCMYQRLICFVQTILTSYILTLRSGISISNIFFKCSAVVMPCDSWRALQCYFISDGVVTFFCWKCIWKCWRNQCQCYILYDYNSAKHLDLIVWFKTYL